jgi:hypothetical protein
MYKHFILMNLSVNIILSVADIHNNNSTIMEIIVNLLNKTNETNNS